mmetsp:Transcript_7528/g.18660  ORF Transcript_7528/g.18660 Transcript_7528/m.18660 type:complete len:225 (+) Transcript_7528:31-705(+)
MTWDELQSIAWLRTIRPMVHIVTVITCPHSVIGPHAACCPSSLPCPPGKQLQPPGPLQPAKTPSQLHQGAPHVLALDWLLVGARLAGGLLLRCAPDVVGPHGDHERVDQHLRQVRRHRRQGRDARPARTQGGRQRGRRDDRHRHRQRLLGRLQHQRLLQPRLLQRALAAAQVQHTGCHPVERQEGQVQHAAQRSRQQQRAAAHRGAAGRGLAHLHPRHSGQAGG